MTEKQQDKYLVDMLNQAKVAVDNKDFATAKILLDNISKKLNKPQTVELNTLRGVVEFG